MEARAASGSSSSVSFHLRRGLGFSDSLVNGFEVLSIGFEASPLCSLMVAARGLLVTVVEMYVCSPTSPVARVVVCGFLCVPFTAQILWRRLCGLLRSHLLLK
ncbi:hypothetical protein Bca52824_040527 [Brassica carinata]|uniref:Uncharacterized protein n=1 Tax=Brassica carinata TaxID=52824 RepID=A0A8X7RR58_BRACI|nr:hypothetical protein Bca52824_040527 [Brassica carinata]